MNVLSELEDKTRRVRAEGVTPKYAIMSPAYFMRLKHALIRKRVPIPDIAEEFAWVISTMGGDVSIVVLGILGPLECYVVGPPDIEFLREVSNDIKR